MAPLENSTVEQEFRGVNHCDVHPKNVLITMGSTGEPLEKPRVALVLERKASLYIDWENWPCDNDVLEEESDVASHASFVGGPKLNNWAFSGHRSECPLEQHIASQFPGCCKSHLIAATLAAMFRGVHARRHGLGHLRLVNDKPHRPSRNKDQRGEGLLAEVRAHILKFSAAKVAQHMAAAESIIMISLNPQSHNR
ncbi:hypothetical protein LY76DRAFT_645182 [Colletotrichum caudatum]|nr:hypothetical protein LY76DRAFT_645182 [Colletotrichum caudatum]